MLTRFALGSLAVAVVLLILGSVFLRSPGQLADEGVPAASQNTGNAIMAKLLDLNPGVWERFDSEQRIKHVRDLIRKYENVPQTDQGGKFPALFYVISSLLNESNRPAEALEYLDRVERAAGTEDWLHYSKAITLEKMGEAKPAIDEFIQSLSYSMAPEVGARLTALSRREGIDTAQHWPKVRELMAARAKQFEPFSLKTPTGEPRSLSDYRNEATLIGFFFPG